MGDQIDERLFTSEQALHEPGYPEPRILTENHFPYHDDMQPYTLYPAEQQVYHRRVGNGYVKTEPDGNESVVDGQPDTKTSDSTTTTPEIAGSSSSSPTEDVTLPVPPPELKGIDQKRQDILTRNRIAARKCRARKKQMVAELRDSVKRFVNENDALEATINQQREEIIYLKTTLLRMQVAMAKAAVSDF